MWSKSRSTSTDRRFTCARKSFTTSTSWTNCARRAPSSWRRLARGPWGGAARSARRSVGARAIFSAHGVAPEVRREAAARRLEVIDATCPLVTKVHLEAVRFARDGYSIVLIGHRHHDEVTGTLGEAPESSYLVETVEDVDRLKLPDPARVRYLTQTTLSLDETRDIIVRLKRRYPL